MPFERERRYDIFVTGLALLFCLIGMGVNRLTYGSVDINESDDSTTLSVIAYCGYHKARQCYDCIGSGCNAVCNNDPDLPDGCTCYYIDYDESQPSVNPWPNKGNSQAVLYLNFTAFLMMILYLASPFSKDPFNKNWTILLFIAAIFGLIASIQWIAASKGTECTEEPTLSDPSMEFITEKQGLTISFGFVWSILAIIAGIVMIFHTERVKASPERQLLSNANPTTMDPTIEQDL